jgi:glycosidase
VNWRNPELREAMLDVLRFWLDRSVDGFRVDVMWLLIKDDQFRACCHSITRTGPRSMSWLRRA